MNDGISSFLGFGPEVLTGSIAAIAAPHLSLGEIEQAEKALIEEPQVECPVTERFAPGCYIRECFMPAGSFVLGHAHKTEHFNIVLTGRALVRVGDEVSEMKSGDVFVSPPGIRKCLYIVEGMRWLTVHPTMETNEDRLRELLIEPSETWKAHELENFKVQIKALL